MRRDEELIVPGSRRVDIISIYVRVVDVFISLNQAHSRMLEGSNLGVPVQQATLSLVHRFLVLEVLFRLGQLPHQSELGV